MATITSSASCNPSTISVRGRNTSTGTISWSLPSIPNGATINSRILTGSASSYTSGGKGASLTINGTNVSSGSSFNINLGANNTTTSITASFTGSHNQTNTSVTLSNLVYTVDYTIVDTTPYTVTFVDYDGTVLKTETVISGNSATAPNAPSRTGYEFIGWDKNFTNITNNLTVTAQYQILTYTVQFIDYDGSILKIQTVSHDSAALAPTGMSREGYTFIGWDISFINVTSNLIVNALYQEIVINNTTSTIFIGNFNVNNIYLGNATVNNVYLGNQIIYSS